MGGSCITLLLKAEIVFVLTLIYTSHYFPTRPPTLRGDGTLHVNSQFSLNIQLFRESFYDLRLARRPLYLLGEGSTSIPESRPEASSAV